MTRLIPSGIVGTHRHLVAQADACFGIGHAFGLQAVNRFEDPSFIGTRCRLQNDVGIRPIDDNADRVARPQLLDQQFQRALDQAEAVVHIHRAGDVDHEGQRSILAFLLRDLVALDADAQHLVTLGLGKGRGRAVDVDPKGLVRGRVGIALLEVIDIFLHAHRIAGRQVPILQVIAHDRVRTRIHIQREGGEIVILGIDGRIDPIVFEEHIIGAQDRKAGQGNSAG